MTLRVDRRCYEFARAWAAFHADAEPAGTAEDQMEGYLNLVLISHMVETGWNATPEIEALYHGLEQRDTTEHDMDDGIPF